MRERWRLVLREAESRDLIAILKLMSDGSADVQDGVDLEPTPNQWAAFEAIEGDPRHELVCAIDETQLVGTMQLSCLPGLARDGAWRLQVQAVWVHHERRGQGIGGAMLEWAVGRARHLGCASVQLMSNRARSDAHRFYSQHGFERSHVGFKRSLETEGGPAAPTDG